MNAPLLICLAILLVVMTAAAIAWRLAGAVVRDRDEVTTQRRATNAIGLAHQWPTDVELRTSALNESRQARSYSKVLAVECPTCNADVGRACKTGRGLYAIYPHMPRQQASRKKGSKR